MQIQVQDSQSVNLKKIGKALEVDVANMPEVSLQHVFNYGLRQLLNDAMASAGDDAAKAEAQAKERLANLMSGTLRASRESDPVAAEAKRLAYRMIDDALITHYGSAKKAKEAEDDYDRAAMARDLLAGENGDAIRAQAKVNVDGVKGLGKITIKI